MKVPPISLLLFAPLLLALPACQKLEAQSSEEHIAHTIVVTRPVKEDVITTQEYVCQIHSRRHIEVRALQPGYLEEITVNEGQVVKQGDVMFRIFPVLYQAELDAKKAEAQLAEIELNNTRKLYADHVVSMPVVRLAEAKLAKAQAEVKLAMADLNFTEIKAPFDGIIDRLYEQQGSLIEEGDMLTTLSDNNVMWVYFNVPEARYLEYMADLRGGAVGHQNIDHDDDDDLDDDDDDDDDDDKVEMEVDDQEDVLPIELVLANGQKFHQTGHISAIEADFNNENGNIAFRADFPNPKGLLRHGQTGTVLIHRELEDALVIPQRATFTQLKQYVWVVDKDGVVHQREIEVQQEMEDIYIIAKGLTEGDQIVLDGIRQVEDGEKVEYEFRDPEEVLSNLKYHAE